ncbi:MAG: Xylulose kinase [Planctomycetes bacterium ADurb.Bin126]|nr:MAG: Xylulose kinase [Planctomycetes bacterium ADurb.Bin126]HOD81969.1 FGGY family carbohydrate kinase [Phycisphaerae bacterium]HQL76340.1 FGGY family carbohydrate kinase [Phycisphaerae bacterium]
MATYLAGLDVGTTGVRAAVFDLDGNMLASDYREYGSSYPRPGWVEQDPREMVAQAFATCRAAVAASGVNAAEIAAVGFSAQRSVTVPLDAAGQPVRPAISWQDARPAGEVAWLAERIDAGEYHRIAGVPLGTTWLAPKVLWMRSHEPDHYARTARFVQVQDYVLRAFGADDYYTDLPCMCFSGAWDVRQARWSDKLLGLMGLRAEQFGKPRPAGTKVGELSAEVASRCGLAKGTALCVGAGDQNCSVVGMGAIRSGMATVTLGTAGLAILASDQPLSGLSGMMITNHAAGGLWEAEGLSNAAASSYRWFRDAIGTAEVSAQAAGGPNAYEALNELAASSPAGSRGLLFLPYLATAGTPRWNAAARGVFAGLSFAHGRGDLARSVMEGVALEIRDMMNVWLEAGLAVDVLRLGGGAVRSGLWNHIQADVYGRPVQTLRCQESTVLGAAMLGGLGAGVFDSLDQAVGRMVQVADQIEPDPAHHALYGELYEAYVKTYQGLADGGAFEKLAAIQSKC